MEARSWGKPGGGVIRVWRRWRWGRVLERAACCLARMGEGTFWERMRW